MLKELVSGGKTSDILIRDFRKSDLDVLLDLVSASNAEEFKITGFDPDHRARAFIGDADTTVR